eukprot:403361640
MITNLLKSQWKKLSCRQNQNHLGKFRQIIDFGQTRNFSYNFQKVDKFWQQKWEQENQSKIVNEQESNSQDQKQKKYILGQFPYPSGNLHMGHVRVYTICDALARYYKQKGLRVINPMGWDSFGLPAENAAISRGINPEIWTNQNIQEMKEQLNRLGFDFDWDKELATHTPEYYKFTQKIFLDLYEKGLAYRKDAYVNWDPVDQTVLANEQIDANGCSWRSGAKVEKKLMKQWFFKIRHYASAMQRDLQHLSKWPDTVKEIQRGWIGESQGANIKFNLRLQNDEELPLTIFTTRPDTIYGVTFLALAYDNPLVQQYLLKNNAIDQNAYDRYLDRLETLKAKGKDLKQIDLNDIDEGIKLSNVKAVHPLTGEEIPVYLTSYVLSDYGTGAIMGVPFHDDRDCCFAVKNNINMIQVVTGDEENDLDNCQMSNSQEFSGLNRKEALQRIIDKIESMNVGKATYEYRMRDWLVSRQRYWGAPIPIILCDSCGEQTVAEKDLPVLLPKIGESSINLKQSQPLGSVETFVNCKCPKCGGNAKREVDTLDTFVDSSWYFMRFLDSQNINHICEETKRTSWMPVDVYVGGMEHAIMHLLYARFIYKFIDESRRNGQERQLIDGHPQDEPFKELVVQGLVKGKTYKLKSNGKYIFREDVPNFKEEDLIVTFEKMSKSKGNGILPDDIASKYGVDTLRLALMFAAPPESDVNFDENFITSMKDYLDRVNRLSEYVTSQGDIKISNKTEIQHKYKKELIEIYKLMSDYVIKIEDQRFFHVSIARLMELTNRLQKLRQLSDEGSQQVLAVGLVYLIQGLYPFAPHLTSDIWQELETKSRLITQLGLNPIFNQNTLDDFKTLLQEADTKVKLKISLDNQMLGEIEVSKDLQGDPQKILEYIIQEKPANLKKIEKFFNKTKVEDYEKIVAPQNKPIISFVSKK